MGRKTYSFSAVAVAAAATLGFSSADGAEAFAQDRDVQAQVQDAAAVPAAEPIELVPETAANEDIAFVSNAVVQDLPEEPEPKVLKATSLRELVAMMDRDAELTEQLRCLAGAVYFESRGEPLHGQLAVAEVIINRTQDRRWPASYCGVVYQRSQFSFVRGGKMPRINTSSAAWTRAKAVAQIAHEGLWEPAADGAVYFHANYVSPRWSRSKTRLTQIDTHVFYR
jgi:hypothetical protein